MDISDAPPWSQPGTPSGSQGVTGSPDFVMHDRGDTDDHWSRADGETCTKCGAELTAGDFVRRRNNGGWVHESCPPVARTAAEPAADDAPDAG